MERIEHEEFLTREDFKRINVKISNRELEEISGHPVEDKRKNNINNIKKKDNSNSDQLSLADLPVVRKESLPENTNRKKISEINLPENIPAKDIRVLRQTTKVKGRTKSTNSYRCGYLTDEYTCVKKYIENGKWTVSDGCHKYQALSKIPLSYVNINTNEPITVYFYPGDTFWAPTKGEDSDKRREILKSLKKK